MGLYLKKDARKPPSCLKFEFTNAVHHVFHSFFAPAIFSQKISGLRVYASSLMQSRRSDQKMHQDRTFLSGPKAPLCAL